MHHALGLGASEAAAGAMALGINQDRVVWLAALVASAAGRALVGGWRCDFAVVAILLLTTVSAPSSFLHVLFLVPLFGLGTGNWTQQRVHEPSNHTPR